MKTINAIGIFILGALLFMVSIYLNGVYDHQIKQEVTVNNILDHRFEINTYPFPFKMRKDNGTIDSVELLEYKKIMVLRDKRLYSPYKLITTYNHHSVTDYGNAKDIDSIKCIRYNEMVVDKAKYDAMDIASKKQQEEIEKAEQDKESELDRLNKSCN